MLNLKKLLTKGLTRLLASQTFKSATVASGFSGDCKYIHFGNICVFSGYVNTSGALTAGQTIVSGLPTYYSTYQNFGIVANNNNSSTEVVNLMFNGGELRVKTALTSANRILRFSGAYLTSAVGGYCITVFSRLSAILRSVRGWSYAEPQETAYKDTESASRYCGECQSRHFIRELKRGIFGDRERRIIDPIRVQTWCSNSAELGFIRRRLLPSGKSKRYNRYGFSNEKDRVCGIHNSKGIPYLCKGIATISRKGVMACA